MNPKIGMNMFLWTTHVTEEHYGVIEELKEIGYDGIEIFINQGDLAHYTRLGKHLADMGMGVTAAATLTPEENIVSPDKKLRQAGLDRLKWLIDAGAAAHVDIICGPFHSGFGHFTRQAPTSDEKQRCAEVLRAAAEHAEGTGVVLTPEAVNRFECYMYNTMADLSTLVTAVDHPNLGAMYDTHHANLEEKSQADAIRLIAPQLKHFHVSENDRGAPGSGQVHWEEVFGTLREIDYQGWVTIEAFCTAQPDFANAINVWRDFSPFEAIYKGGYRFIKEGLSS